jgi:hypothetical protein
MDVVFRIEIKLGNDAMKSAGDVKRKLKELAGKVQTLSDNGEERRIMDDNGNSVGKWGFYGE